MWSMNNEIGHHQTFEDKVYWENREKTAVYRSMKSEPVNVTGSLNSNAVWAH